MAVDPYVQEEDRKRIAEVLRKSSLAKGKGKQAIVRRQLDGVRSSQAKLTKAESNYLAKAESTAAIVGNAYVAQAAAAEAEQALRGASEKEIGRLVNKINTSPKDNPPGSQISDRNKTGLQKNQIQPPQQTPENTNGGDESGQDDSEENEENNQSGESTERPSLGKQELKRYQKQYDQAETTKKKPAERQTSNAESSESLSNEASGEEGGGQALEAQDENTKADESGQPRAEEQDEDQEGAALPERGKNSRPEDSVKWGDGTDPAEVAYRRKKLYQDSVEFNKRAARAARAEGIGKVGAKALEGIAALGRAIALLYTGPTAPVAWVVTIAAVLALILAIGISSGFLGSSTASPAGPGKSMSEPVLATDPILGQIVNASNIADVQTMMANNKQIILDALQKIETQLATGKYDPISSAQTTPKIQEIRQILEQASNDNPAQNASLAPKFQKAVKELLEIWLAADAVITGTQPPLRVTPTGFGSTNHYCSAFDTSRCVLGPKDKHHRSVFGIVERLAGVPLTADVADISAPEGSIVYAPFDGNLSGDHLEDSEGSFLTGTGNYSNMQAVLLHMTTTARYGAVKAGDQVGKLNSNKHLHFELKIGGRDVARTSISQSQEDLWTKMKKILGGN